MMLQTKYSVKTIQNKLFHIYSCLFFHALHTWSSVKSCLSKLQTPSVEYSFNAVESWGTFHTTGGGSFCFICCLLGGFYRQSNDVGRRSLQSRAMKHKFEMKIPIIHIVFGSYITFWEFDRCLLNKVLHWSVSQRTENATGTHTYDRTSRYA